jgi:hypothetical protein
MRASLPHLLHGYEQGRMVGDVQNAIVNLILHDQAAFECGGKPLSVAAADIRQHIAIAEGHQQNALKVYCLILLQTIQNLRGLDNLDTPGIMSGNVINPKEIIDERATDAVNHYGMQLAYIFDDFEQAGKYRDACKGYGEKFHLGHCTVIRHFLFRGLTSLALAARGHRRCQNRKEAAYALKKLKDWQTKGNPNVVPMVLLLQAEYIATLSGKKNQKKAEVLFKRGVQTATRSGWIHMAALLHERAGVFYATPPLDDQYWASHHFSHAIQCYHEWGAEAKVRAMAEMYGHLVVRSKHTSFISRELCSSFSRELSEDGCLRHY